MDTEPTIEAQLLGHAERQTKALETLQGYAVIALMVGGVGIALWAILAMFGG